jgi:hypothetical protein
MNIPEIRIQSSMLLFNSISEDEKKKWASNINQEALTFPEIENYTIELQKAWEEHAQTVLKAMVDLYGIEFKKSIIDIYVSPWNKSISNPLILNPSRPPEIQIDTVMHELLHVLFTDNTSFSMHDKDQETKLIDEWRSMFGSELEWKTLVHIPVHAGLKSIFLDTLYAPERLERDILLRQNNPAYRKAWEYVEKNDYVAINTRLKELYARLSE